MSESDPLSELGNQLEVGIAIPPFAAIQTRHGVWLRRKRRRRTVAMATGVTLIVSVVALTALSFTHGPKGRPATLTTVSSPGASPATTGPAEAKGITWLRVVIDQAGEGFAIGADCGSGRPFCRYVVRHTADDAETWQPVPPPTGPLIPNPMRLKQNIAAATDGNRLWFQSFSTLMTGTATGGWTALEGPVADFDQNNVAGSDVIVERSFRTLGNKSPCGPGVALMTATGFQPLPHQPRQPYQTDETRVASDGSLWDLSPAYPTGCVLKLGQQVHGKVITRAASTTATWAHLRPAPDITTNSFRALDRVTAVGLLTSRNVTSYDATIELKLLSTIDGGLTWRMTDLHKQSTYAHENDGGVLNAFDIEHLLITTDAGVEATADGGKTFTTSVAPVAGDQVAAVSVTGATSAVVVTTNGVVVTTSDKGQQWTPRTHL